VNAGRKLKVSEAPQLHSIKHSVSKLADLLLASTNDHSPKSVADIGNDDEGGEWWYQDDDWLKWERDDDSQLASAGSTGADSSGVGTRSTHAAEDGVVDDDSNIRFHWALLIAGSSGWWNYRHQVLNFCCWLTGCCSACEGLGKGYKCCSHVLPEEAASAA
jgi:hypothetical protein